MRQILIQVPHGCGKQVLNIAKSHNGTNLAQIEAKSSDEVIELVMVNLSNHQVGQFIEELQDLPKVHITLIPTGVLALKPPPEEAAQQVKDVQERSPIEVFLSSLQSVGSWRGFLGYAALAGVVVWIGLYTNTTYLLVAAMLIAPFAGPAMNTAIATARGDRQLLWRSLLRYFAALAVTIGIAWLLSLVLRQQIATSLMIERSQLSAVAVLLPLAAGAAGALNLMQSERSSLVSGAATGMLVAASLAPPAGIVGMASAIGRWEMVTAGLFLLLLQLCGINLSASLLFRIFGLSAQATRYQRGNKRVFRFALVITVIALVGLLTWQFSNSPNLERSSRAQRANAEVQKAVEQVGLAKLVESNVRFTRANISGQNTLLSVVYVQRQPGVSQSSEEIRSLLTQAIQTHLLNQGFNITPLVDVSVLELPTNKK
ncbi:MULTISPECIES: DUF389 domain-containing protein [unclassified Tolypothrix]|uniref:DUF389 domain-containing protein n=1 Tax=unclassified Tolypothrix TaxID=2649714 RepID=UPI0005EAB6D2|nr:MULTISPECIES: DUF389 domain-containing protein [unclassified Tolypothrix]BAY92716.1 hypothetical protein NIES3275_47530 [Microchaete diplosiphon NIES-3275]EKF05821.1 hypothetical protein FDUTEX481_00680 [Tolypothrix sp. PCC 7601]MBE9081474.1 DUF389 domain-containing protein [Tolypothrix sp. LEGE 11397]UYD26645.1 DUF389 domain-containing protein [Tolypothrix sp. PCC 7712]UYD37496.1 DUF389 domain-containing protein [Tolypothrix sp. PCC 7601]